LVDCFRQAFEELGVRGRVLGVDASPGTAPAAHRVDQCFAVERCDHPEFIDSVLKTAIRERVSLIVPTIDTELAGYAANRQKFLDHGIRIAVSDPETIRIAGDKTETHRWLTANDFPSPRQAGIEEILENPDGWDFPVILKPRWGSASAGILIARSLREMKALVQDRSGLIAQQMMKGIEYTVNAFVQDGKCICAVPHRRLETRGGEVSKGITVRDEGLMRLATAIAERLPGARDALNIQCFVLPDGTIRVIEINARFGGGFPLACRAGAKFPLWLLEPLLGRPVSGSADWEDGLLMLRYDEAVFLSRAQRE
jgi:carbamoyl-phosphate synthase large subunit